jgi:hypothetical protein
MPPDASLSDSRDPSPLALSLSLWQGDRSGAFYLIERGEVQMTLTPAGADNDEDEEAVPIPVRKYKAGECFGASGLLPGDSVRRNTATAVGPARTRPACMCSPRRPALPHR